MLPPGSTHAKAPLVPQNGSKQVRDAWDTTKRVSKGRTNLILARTGAACQYLEEKGSPSLLGNPLPVGAREVRRGGEGLDGRPLVPPHGLRPIRKNAGRFSCKFYEKRPERLQA